MGGRTSQSDFGVRSEFGTDPNDRRRGALLPLPKEQEDKKKKKKRLKKS